MSTLNLKLSNRSPKQPIKNLPASISIPNDTTIEGLKRLIAKGAGIQDYNRIGIFDAATKKTFKDRCAVIKDEKAIVDSGEVLVKDLGPQIGWRLVYVIEYFGPLLIHPAILALRPYIYPGSPAPTDLSQSQKLTFVLMMLHFVKREVETLFVHKFSANTMPFFNVFKNSAFYWLMGGLLNAVSVYHPWSLAAKANEPIVDVIGVALYVFGQIANARVHLYLSSLRPTGTTEKKIPVGYGFSFVTCPNYMYELIVWAGLILVSRDVTVIATILTGSLYMYSWGKGKESAYRKQFGDRYKKKRYVMLPGLL
jgi:very-long-chain enoyl-CoA reductase